MSAPSSPVQDDSGYSSPPGKRTRTVAIVKNHALDHRFDIEMRMTEAGFEVCTVNHSRIILVFINR